MKTVSATLVAAIVLGASTLRAADELAVIQRLFKS